MVLQNRTPIVQQSPPHSPRPFPWCPCAACNTTSKRPSRTTFSTDGNKRHDRVGEWVFVEQEEPCRAWCKSSDVRTHGISCVVGLFLCLDPTAPAAKSRGSLKCILHLRVRRPPSDDDDPPCQDASEGRCKPGRS